MMAPIGFLKHKKHQDEMLLEFSSQILELYPPENIQNIIENTNVKKSYIYRERGVQSPSCCPGWPSLV